MNQARQAYDVDEVRDRTDLLSLIGSTVTLRKQSGGRYTGLCPFHQEKSPSFGVDPQKGFWHCFGCGAGGDAFTFVMRQEHLTFPEALERLAQRAGIHPRATHESPQRKEERDFLFEVNTAAAEAFRAALRGKAGGAARAYLEKRGITAEYAQRFGLGYAPAGWDQLATHLRKRGFALELMAKANLAMARSNGEGYIDRFRNRVMVPIHDRQGRVVAFGGRALSPEDQPKYLNTSETPVFSKGRTLYALHLATEQIAKRGRAIITEGYFDTIACHLADFPEAVATLGTALSEDHVKILHRLVGDGGTIFLVYDADSAGINAALRGQAIFRAAGANVRIVLLPAGHDPDTLLREQGRAAFETCLRDALSPVEFELKQALRTHPSPDDPEGRVRLFKTAAAILQPLSALERAEYAMWLLDRWLGGSRGDVAQLQQAILSEVSALDRAPRRNERGDTANPYPAPPLRAVADIPLERDLLAAMVQEPAFAARILAEVPSEAVTHPGYRTIFDALLRMSQEGMPPDARRIVLEDDATASLIAALAVCGLPVESQSPERMVERMREEYEKIRLRPREISLDDPEALRAYTAKLRERSQRTAKRIFGQD